VDFTRLVIVCSAGVALVHPIVLVARSPFLEFGSQCILVIRGFRYTRTGVIGTAVGCHWHSCGFVLYAFARVLMWALFCSRLGFPRLGGFWCTVFRGFFHRAWWVSSLGGLCTPCHCALHRAKRHFLFLQGQLIGCHTELTDSGNRCYSEGVKVVLQRGVSSVSSRMWVGLHMPLVDGSQLLAASRLSLFCLGCGVRERWCVAHPCLVWENSPWWWFEFKGPPLRSDAIGIGYFRHCARSSYPPGAHFKVSTSFNSDAAARLYRGAINS